MSKNDVRMIKSIVIFHQTGRFGYVITSIRIQSLHDVYTKDPGRQGCIAYGGEWGGWVHPNISILYGTC